MFSQYSLRLPSDEALTVEPVERAPRGEAADAGVPLIEA